MSPNCSVKNVIAYILFNNTEVLINYILINLDRIKFLKCGVSLKPNNAFFIFSGLKIIFK